MYQFIQDVAKFRSLCDKYKIDFYPELFYMILNFIVCLVFPWNGSHFIVAWINKKSGDIIPLGRTLVSRPHFWV